MAWLVENQAESPGSRGIATESRGIGKLRSRGRLRSSVFVLAKG